MLRNFDILFLNDDGLVNRWFWRGVNWLLEGRRKRGSHRGWGVHWQLVGRRREWGSRCSRGGAYIGCWKAGGASWERGALLGANEAAAAGGAYMGCWEGGASEGALPMFEAYTGCR